ncbi:hypothetical protein BH20ACI2_BH20ACI2_24230 [soil metagenome]
MIESYLSKNIPNQPPRGNLDLRLATETVFRDEKFWEKIMVKKSLTFVIIGSFNTSTSS